MSIFKISVIFLLSTFHFLFSPAPILAAPSAWSGACIANDDVATIKGLECLVGNILQVIVYISGLVFLIMFIVGGFQYLFSRGDPKAAAAASSTLTHAFLGLIGVIASWLILKFIGQFTGLDVTNFTLPSP